MNNETTFEAGLRMRREVLGQEHVDRSLAAASEFRRLQTAIYFGVPAALEAQRTAERVLAEEGALTPGGLADADSTLG